AKADSAFNRHLPDGWGPSASLDWIPPLQRRRQGFSAVVTPPWGPGHLRAPFDMQYGGRNIRLDARLRGPSEAARGSLGLAQDRLLSLTPALSWLGPSSRSPTFVVVNDVLSQRARIPDHRVGLCGQSRRPEYRVHRPRPRHGRERGPGDIPPRPAIRPANPAHAVVA